jgi:toxin ParE1/3/4
MTRFSVEFAPEAARQLEDLQDYIAEKGSPRVASDHVDAIVDYCESLRTFSNRGVSRDDVRPGLRVTHYKGSTVIAFALMGEVVYILGVFYGGQDYETALSAIDS